MKAENKRSGETVTPITKKTDMYFQRLKLCFFFFLNKERVG